MKSALEKIIMLILDCIAEILNFLDVAIPIMLLVAYRVIVIILLYDIVCHLNTIIRITKGG